MSNTGKSEVSRPEGELAPPQISVPEEIVLLGDREKLRVLEILEEVYGDSVSRRSSRLWDWKLSRNPFWSEGASSLVGYLVNGEVMGCVLSIPTLLKFEENVYPSTCPVDLVMSKKLKGKALLGHSLRMCRLITSSNDFCFGQAGEGLEKLWAKVVKLKDVVIGDYYFCYSILRVDQIIHQRLKLPLFVGSVAQWFWAIFRAMVRDRFWIQTEPGLQFETIKEVPTDFDHFWTKVSAGIPRLSVRNSAYLQWRFFRMPDPGQGYVVRVARREGILVGYTVTRMDEDRNLKRAILVDILGEVTDRRLWNSLLLDADRQARQVKADLMSAHELHLSELSDLLRNHWFVRSRKFMRYVVGTRLAAWKNEALYDRRRWFFTYADNDSDLTL